MVSHSLNYLVSHCDRLIWLDQGRIVADGAAADVARDYLSHMGHTTEPVALTEPERPADTDVQGRRASAPVT